jgi:D-beta-D-heptose 7-phosphate kinase/D-beta-D-heptose 1-phosphate adenosyltransferase
VPIFKFIKQETKSGMAGNVFNNLTVLDCDVDFMFNELSTKTRLIDLKSKQQIVRIDDDKISTPVNVDISNLNCYDAIVISDYNKGTVDSNTIKTVVDNAVVPIFIDTKKTDLSVVGSAWVKINSVESEKLKISCNNIIVTLGGEGAEYKNKIYPAPSVEVSDVCGAGDTFLAALVVEFLKSKNIESAIKFANRAAAVTVQHIGVYAPTLKEIG